MIDINAEIMYNDKVQYHSCINIFSIKEVSVWTVIQAIPEAA